MRLVYRPGHPKANSNGLVDVTQLENDTAQAVYVIRDEMDALRHHGDGQMYTSKSKFRQATRASGCIELGNDAAPKPRKPIQLDKRARVEAIKQAIYQLKNS